MPISVQRRFGGAAQHEILPLMPRPSTSALILLLIYKRNNLMYEKHTLVEFCYFVSDYNQLIAKVLRNMLSVFISRLMLKGSPEIHCAGTKLYFNRYIFHHSRMENRHFHNHVIAAITAGFWRIYVVLFLKYVHIRHEPKQLNKKCNILCKRRDYTSPRNIPKMLLCIFYRDINPHPIELRGKFMRFA